MAAALDFEKPILEIQGKIEELKNEFGVRYGFK